jgi:hypothetical protein
MSNLKYLVPVLGLALAALGAPAPASAVEYVKICSAGGDGYFYIPGSPICINAETGTTYDPATGKYTENRFDLAFQGAAIAMAMPTPVIDFGKRFAIAGNVSNYEGNQGLALAGAFKATDGLSFSAAVGIGLNQTAVGSRAGFNFSW